MFEGIKIVTTLECVRGFAPKGWTNGRQSLLTVISLLKWTRARTKDFFSAVRVVYFTTCMLSKHFLKHLYIKSSG